MPQSYLHQVIYGVAKSFRDLALEVPSKKIEQVAFIVHEAMGATTREFHSLRHIFDVAAHGDPIETLAAFFHDTVYFQIDRQLPPLIASLIAPLATLTNDGFKLSGADQFEDPTLSLCLKIFAHSPGDVVSLKNGQNEFLSALAATCALGNTLTMRHLLEVLVCIEATIPFRNDGTIKDTTLVMHARVTDLSRELDLQLSHADIDGAVARSVRLSNRDLHGFSQDDPGIFLVDSWKLFMESNPSLKDNTYSIKDYRQALQKMEAFTSLRLNAEHVFTAFKGSPDQEQLSHMKACARHNIRCASGYFRMRLLSIAVVEALADLSGGDAPLSLFMGDLSDNRSFSLRMGELLDKALATSNERLQMTSRSPIFQLLAYGFTGAFAKALKSSPLSAYIFLLLGEENATSHFLTAQAFWDGRLEPMQFLAMLDAEIVAHVARLTSEVAVTRQPQLASLADTFAMASQHQTKVG